VTKEEAKGGGGLLRLPHWHGGACPTRPVGRRPRAALPGRKSGGGDATRSPPAAAARRAHDPGGDGGLRPSRPIIRYPEHYAQVGRDQRSAGNGWDENGVAAMMVAAMSLHELRVADDATSQTEGGGRCDESGG